MERKKIPLIRFGVILYIETRIQLDPNILINPFRFEDLILNINEEENTESLRGFVYPKTLRNVHRNPISKVNISLLRPSEQPRDLLGVHHLGVLNTIWGLYILVLCSKRSLFEKRLSRISSNVLCHDKDKIIEHNQSFNETPQNLQMKISLWYADF